MLDLHIHIRFVEFSVKNNKLKLKEEKWLHLFDANNDVTEILQDSSLICIKYLYFYLFFFTSFYLFVDLSITLLFIFLTDDLPRSQTVPVWEPPCCVLEHLIQGVQPRLQWCHQLLNWAHRPVGSLWTSHQRTCLRPPGSILLWAIDAPIFWCGEPAEDAGGQKGDEGVDGHDAAEEEQQPRVQVLLQLHLARTAASSGWSWGKQHQPATVSQEWKKGSSLFTLVSDTSFPLLKVKDNLTSVTTKEFSDWTLHKVKPTHEGTDTRAHVFFLPKKP